MSFFGCLIRSQFKELLFFPFVYQVISQQLKSQQQQLGHWNHFRLRKFLFDILTLISATSSTRAVYMWMGGPCATTPGTRRRPWLSAGGINYENWTQVVHQDVWLRSGCGSCPIALFPRWGGNWVCNKWPQVTLHWLNNIGDPYVRKFKSTMFSGAMEMNYTSFTVYTQSSWSVALTRWLVSVASKPTVI